MEKPEGSLLKIIIAQGLISMIQAIKEDEADCNERLERYMPTLITYAETHGHEWIAESYKNGKIDNLRFTDNIILSIYEVDREFIEK